MASSPTSSCSSSYSSPFASSKFSSLPVMSLRDKIVEKIEENRVTLIVGDTGCGIYFLDLHCMSTFGPLLLHYVCVLLH